MKFFTRRGVVQAVRGATFRIDSGETLALVGESGSGKSVTSKAILGLISLPGRIIGGDIRWKGHSLLATANRAYAKEVRGREISVIFQDPVSSLNPLLTVGQQVMEPLRHHRRMSRKAARERAVELLDMVGLSAPRQRLGQYPHQFSGGMNQRICIAMALATEPHLLIADEPTTALDATIQAQILELLADLQKNLRLAVLLITHDLGVVAGLSQRMAVMYAGRIIESDFSDEVFKNPGHPYSRGLLRSIPHAHSMERLQSIPGNPPDMIDPPTGCPFHPRCPLRIEQCKEKMPSLERYGEGHMVACYRAFTVDVSGR